MAPNTWKSALLALLVVTLTFTGGLSDKGHQHRAQQTSTNWRPRNGSPFSYAAPASETSGARPAGIHRQHQQPAAKQQFYHPTRRPVAQRQRVTHQPTPPMHHALRQMNDRIRQQQQQSHAPRPAYLPVPVSVPLTAHSLVIPSPPQQASYQVAASAYSGQYRPAQQPQYPAPQPQQPAPQPQYPAPQPQYPGQQPAQAPYPAPAPAYQQEAQSYSAPAPTAAPFPVLPPLPVPIYARRPQVNAGEYAAAPVEHSQQEGYAAPPAEYATSAPVEATEAAPEAQISESAPVGGYSPDAPVTIPPTSDELTSTDSPVAEQDVQTNTIAKTPTKSEESQWSQGSIPWTLEKLGLNTLNDLLVLAGLDETFDKDGPFTVFVPLDQAFEILVKRFGGMEKATEEFNKNPEVLTTLLKHHVVPGTIPSSALQNNAVSQSLLGTPLRVKFYNAEDAEWRPLKVITVNGARVVRPDIQAKNGLIHIVDRVIFPVPQADVYNTLKNDPQQRYTTLVSAIERAGLVSVLANPTAGPYTVFAPTNKAFSLINRAELNSILNDPARLAKLLQRHVVQDLIYTSGLQGFQKAYALDFEILYIYHAKGMTKVNGANVVDQDLTALNGVIHSIDSVLGLN